MLDSVRVRLATGLLIYQMIMKQASILRMHPVQPQDGFAPTRRQWPTNNTARLVIRPAVQPAVTRRQGPTNSSACPVIRPVARLAVTRSYQ